MGRRGTGGYPCVEEEIAEPVAIHVDDELKREHRREDYVERVEHAIRAGPGAGAPLGLGRVRGEEQEHQQPAQR